MIENKLRQRRKRKLFEIVDAMGEREMRWDAMASKSSSEPHSDRELLVVIANEISHIMKNIDALKENQDEIRKSISAPTPLYHELKIKLDIVTDSLNELKESVTAMQKTQNDICDTQIRHDTYFKILGAFSVVFPPLLLTAFQIILG